MARKSAFYKAAICVVVAAAILAAAAFLTWRQSRDRMDLVVSNADTGEEYGRYPMEAGDVFSITFIHSVNKSPVTDYYEVRSDGEFYVTATKYYNFGAGVQTEIEDEQTLTYTEDGGMLVSGFNKKMTGMIYVVGMVSDHTLEIGEEEISLRDLCGRGSAVTFTVE